MRGTFLAAVSLLLAGCSGGGGHDGAEPFTCPDQTVLDVESIEGHHESGFDPAAHCPVPPSVRLDGVPATLGAYRTATVSWTLDNGSRAASHSMLTSLRVSPASVADADLGAPDAYGSELQRREHQNLPVTYETTLQFTQAATVYLRAYATIDGEDHWSPEATLRILPVEPTGTVVELTHAPGGPLGDFGPAEAQLLLGDAVAFVNEDVTPHTFTFTSGPGGAVPPAVEVAAMATGAPVPLLVPGTYEVETDDVQPKAATLVVAVPA